MTSINNHEVDDGELQSEADAKPLKYSFWAGALILRGSVTPRVILDVCTFGVIALGVVMLEILAEQLLHVEVSVPVGPFEAAGAVLGLLLVLRTNAGYERWWEARKLWGGIVNQSRNLVIAGLNYGPQDPRWRKDLVMWAASFPHTCRRSLRYETSTPELVRLLGVKEAQRVNNAQHMPNVVAGELAKLLQQARSEGMSELSFYEAERQRSLLIDHLGGCERIRNTPLARSSAIQVRRFILLFLATLPFAWLETFNYPIHVGSDIGFDINARFVLIPLFVMLMSYPLLALDRIGMELQNPFDTRRVDHLPLDAICNTIEHNLIEMLQLDPIGQKAIPLLDEGQFPPDLGSRLKGARDTFIS